MPFSLDDILHGILRGNKHPQDPTCHYFTENDPREAFSSVPPSPEVHFLLCNHMTGSPYARIFDSSDKLSILLKLGAAHYIRGSYLFCLVAFCFVLFYFVLFFFLFSLFFFCFFSLLFSSLLFSSLLFSLFSSLLFSSLLFSSLLFSSLLFSSLLFLFSLALSLVLLLFLQNMSLGTTTTSNSLLFSKLIFLTFGENDQEIIQKWIVPNISGFNHLFLFFFFFSFSLLLSFSLFLSLSLSFSFSFLFSPSLSFSFSLYFFTQLIWLETMGMVPGLESGSPPCKYENESFVSSPRPLLSLTSLSYLDPLAAEGGFEWIKKKNIFINLKNTRTNFLFLPLVLLTPSLWPRP